MVVYSEFQCPYCGNFARETLPVLEEEYISTGRVLLAFRQFPLTMHRAAQKAAEATACAADQDRFWELHDLLFLNQRQLDQASLHGYAKSANLEMERFESCLAGEKTATVDRDVALGKSLEVTGTPTFFVGRLLGDGTVKVVQRFAGALPVDRFRTILNDVLAAAR